MKINILLTFDYELPLGGIAKNYAHSLFDPAKKLLRFSAQMNVPIVLFADILSYERCKELGVNNYTLPFEEQIQESIKQGNDVQLHIHPHWLETKIDELSFKPSQKFTLADFVSGGDTSIINTIIAKGIQALKTICLPADHQYKCIAYRGGGYNLQPYTKEILASLAKNGILFDSTVVPRYYYISDQNKVDFRETPKKPNWFLSHDENTGKTAKKGILEIPIASIRKRIFEVPTALKMKKYAHRAPENRGKMIHAKSNISLMNKLRMLQSNRMLTVDNFTYSEKYLNKIFDYHINKYKDFDQVSLALIGHPKTMGEYSYRLLESFITHVHKNYTNAQFATFQQLL